LNDAFRGAYWDTLRFCIERGISGYEKEWRHGETDITSMNIVLGHYFRALSNCVRQFGGSKHHSHLWARVRTRGWGGSVRASQHTAFEEAIGATFLSRREVIYVTDL